MRGILALLLLPVLSLPVSTFPALAADPATPDAPSARTHPVRQTAKQHFIDANAAHDGHLTREEAKTGYVTVARHFDEIDVDHKGYVTEDDIRAWRTMQKAAHQPTRPADERLRARPAYQTGCPDLHPVGASGSQTIGPAAGPAAQAPTPETASPPAAPAAEAPPIGP
jgi:hypothetical protein